MLYGTLRPYDFIFSVFSMKVLLCLLINLTSPTDCGTSFCFSVCLGVKHSEFEIYEM